MQRLGMCKSGVSKAVFPESPRELFTSHVVQQSPKGHAQRWRQTACEVCKELRISKRGKIKVLSRGLDASPQ